MISPVGDSYSCNAGGAIRAGRNQISPLTALMGDSLTDEGFGLSNFYIANAYLGGKLDLLANSGWSGTTVSGMLGRIDTSFLAVPPGLADLPALGRVFIRAGTNDARGLTAIGTLAATFTSLLNSCATYAQRVIILAVPPLSDTSYNDAAISYNGWLEAFAAANPTVFRFIDDCINVRNIDGTIKPEFFNVDGVHFAREGVAQTGYDLALAMGSEMDSYPSPISSDPADVYPSHPQWIANPTMSGTSGSASGGFSGQVANGLSISGYGTGMSGTCGKVAADVGDENQTEWQRISLTDTHAGSSVWINSSLVGRAMSATDPLELETVTELRLTGLDRTAVAYFDSYVQANTSEYLSTHQVFDLQGTGTETHIYVLRLRRRRSGATTPISALWHLFIGSRATVSGELGTIDFRCMTARG